MVQHEPPAGIPHMDAPEVPEPKKTLPGSIGCLTAFLVALVLIGLALAHFFSMSNYSTWLNVDGTYHFSGTFTTARKVFLSDRYKLVIQSDEKREIVLPPLPSPTVDGRPLFRSLASGAPVDGDITVKKGFLNDLSIRVGPQTYHFDGDAGWLALPK